MHRSKGRPANSIGSEGRGSGEEVGIDCGVNGRAGIVSHPKTCFTFQSKLASRRWEGIFGEEEEPH